MKYLLLLIPLFSDTKISFFSVTLRWFDSIVIIMGFVLFRIFLIEKKMSLDNNLKLLLSLFVFSFSSSLYMIFSLDNIDIGEHIKNLVMNSLRYIEFFIFVYFIYYYLCVKKNISIKQIIISISLAIVFNDIYGLYQYLMNLIEVGNNSLSFILNGSFIYNFRYGYSVENSPNASGVFLVTTLPILVYVFREVKNLKFLYLLFILLHIFLLLITGSKVSYLGLLLIIFLYWVSFAENQPIKGILSGILLLFVIMATFIVLPDVITNRFSTMLAGDESTSERIIRFIVGLNILLESPFTGLGNSNTFHLLFEQYAVGDERHFIRSDLSAHNSFMTFFVSVGLLGLGTMLFYIFMIFNKMNRISIKDLNFAFIGLLFGMVTDDAYNTPLIQILFFLIASLIYYSKGFYNVKNTVTLS